MVYFKQIRIIDYSDRYFLRLTSFNSKPSHCKPPNRNTGRDGTKFQDLLEKKIKMKFHNKNVWFNRTGETQLLQYPHFLQSYYNFHIIPKSYSYKQRTV